MVETRLALLNKPKVELVEELQRYQKAYEILMEWFDFIPEDERQEVSDELDKVGC